MNRVLSILCLLALLTSLSQADVTDFEKALDEWEFEQAYQALPTISEPNFKALCEAEYYLKKERPELALRAIQSVPPSSLSGQRKGKFFLIRAALELRNSKATRSQRTANSLRFIRDGLRSSPSPRDRARLLLLKIGVAPPEQLALAEEAESELAEMENVGNSIDLVAQARLQVRKGRHAQAARLWSTLASSAQSRGQLKSQIAFQFKELKSLEDAGKAEAAARLKKELLNRGLASKNPFIAKLIWKNERSSDRESRRVIANKFHDTLEPSVEKLIFTSWLASDGKERTFKLKLAEQGAEEARLLNEPLLRAYFLHKLVIYSGSKTRNERMKSEITSLMGSHDLEHLRDVWYSGVSSALEDYDFLYSAELQVGNLNEELAAASPEKRIDTIRKYLSGSVGSVKPSVGFYALDLYRKEIETTPKADREYHFNKLLRIFYFIEASRAFTSPPGRHRRASRAMARTLLARMKGDPVFIASLTDAYLSSLSNEQDPEKLVSSYKHLAQWTALLGRDGEARDLLHLASDKNSEAEAQNLLELELFLNRETDPPLTPEQVDELAALKKARVHDSWKVACEMGWLELTCHRPARAEVWARKALAESESVSIYQFLDAGPHRLLAHAEARLGHVEEALQILDQAEQRHPNQSSKFLLSRAIILSEAGRHKEAYISTLGIESNPSLETAILTHRLRSNSARAIGRIETAEKVDAKLDAFLEKETEISKFPVLSLNLKAEFADEYGEQVELPTTTSEFRGLAVVVERLESLRQREPKNQTLRRLGAAEIRGLTETAEADEIFVQPILLEHSIVLLSAVKGDVRLQEVVCDRKKVEKALLSLSTKLSTPTIDVKYASADQEYLSRILVKPWQSLFPNKTKLRWLGEDDFKTLPLSALPGFDGKPLVHHFSTAYLDGPGYSELKLSPKIPALVVGGATDLPGAVRELRVVRQTFSRGSKWNLGGEFGTLKKFASDHKVVHFATHGKAPSAKEASASLAGDFSRLSAFQLSELTFSEDSLAVLGACESNIDAGTGRDNTSLVSALRTAGAKMVIGSLWRLDDSVTADLFGHFYGHLGQGSEPDIALALAQRTVLTQDSHPYYWAGLQVVSGP